MSLPEDVAKEAGTVISRQGGPFAILTTVMIVALLFGVGYVGQYLLPTMKTFIETATSSSQQSSSAITKMANSMNEVHKAHESLLNAMTTTQDAVLRNGDEIVKNGQKIQMSIANAERLLGMMEEAQKIMMESADTRQDTLLRIDEGIKELNAEIKKNGTP